MTPKEYIQKLNEEEDANRIKSSGDEQNVRGVRELGADNVSAPSHYARLAPQPIEVIAAWGMDFFLGGALKYIARAGHKDGADATTDLSKAVSLLQRKIAILRGESPLG